MMGFKGGGVTVKGKRRGEGRGRGKTETWGKKIDD